MPKLEPLKPGFTRIVMPTPEGTSELVQVRIDSDTHRAAIGLPPKVPTPVPAGLSMTFSEALFIKKSYGSNAVLPPDMRAFSLPELEEKAAE